MSFNANIKLSEAIREGAKLRPQLSSPNQGDYAVDEKGNICSCTMGAAYEGARIIRVMDEVDKWHEPGLVWLNSVSVFEFWPVLEKLASSPVPETNYCRCSGWFGLEPRVSEIITHLNDYHGWTREQIADWVEKVELQHGL